MNRKEKRKREMKRNFIKSMEMNSKAVIEQKLKVLFKAICDIRINKTTLNSVSGSRSKTNSALWPNVKTRSKS